MKEEESCRDCTNPLIFGVFVDCSSNSSDIEDKQENLNSIIVNENAYKSKLVKTYLKIRNMLPELDKHKLAISGSFSLAEMGFQSFKDIHDLDLRLYEPSENAVKILSELEDIESPSFTSSFKKNREAGAQFRFDEFDVDVFYERNNKSNVSAYKYETFLMNFHLNGVKKDLKIPVVKVVHVIDAKKKLGRKKDITKLINYRNIILSDQELYDMLNDKK